MAQQIQARLALGQIAFDRPHPTVTLEAYASTWWDHIRQVRKHTTHDDYTKRLNQWILPELGSLRLPNITREKVRSMVTVQLNQGLSPKTVQNNVRVLSSLLSQAIEDGLLAVNVALKPGKFLPKVSKRRQVNPFSREEVSIFLATAQHHAARYYPLFLCAVRTGLRLGELLAPPVGRSRLPKPLPAGPTKLYPWQSDDAQKRGSPPSRYVSRTQSDARRPPHRETNRSFCYSISQYTSMGIL